VREETNANRRVLKPPLALWPLISIGLIQVILHFVTNNNYGIFRDEFYYLECARHLDWGYVDQPPLSIFMLAVSVKLFGVSQWAIRIFPALAGGALVFLGGVIARRLGGGLFAQVLAAVSVLVSPIYLGMTGYYSMNAYDLLFWAILLLMFVDILDGRQGVWPWMGLVAGLGLENKFSVGFLLIGIGVGILLTRRRRLLVDRRVFIAGLIALLVFTPHIIWQISKGWPTLEFMRNAELYKNVALGLLSFLSGQIQENNPLNFLIWMPGLVALLFSRRFRAYRALGIAYLALFVIFALTNGKVYYLAPFFVFLYAAGATAFESFVLRPGWRWASVAIIIVLIISGALLAPLAIPLLSVDRYIKYSRAMGLSPKAIERHAMGELPQHFADRFGWEHLVDKVAGVYFSLSPEERKDCIICGTNYGETGAIDYYGPALGLPPAVSQHNNYFLWGPGNGSGNLFIMIGRSTESLEGTFESIEIADTVSSPYVMPYESNLLITICRKIKIPLDKAWAQGRNFG